MKRNVQGQKQILAKHLDGFERSSFCDFEKLSKRPIKKEWLRSTSKATRKISRNKFVQKDAMSHIVKSFGEVDGSTNRPRARLRLVKIIRNGLRKKQTLIKSRPHKAAKKKTWCW